ncbi:hypothetical protein [Pseudomonas sp. NPDC089569]|uniref:hypothetical protein n=1 Tax=Pseudomonas sp. NPDC089569 TaxID=3390722 RepID=UPI003D086C60
MLLWFGLDAIVFIVLHNVLPPGDNQKCYRFTLKVGKWRICEAQSVDVLFGFGAKIFNRCVENIQFDALQSLNKSLSLSHFSGFCGVSGLEIVHFCGKCFISGRLAAIFRSSSGLRLLFVVKPVTFAGMLPSSRLVRDLSGRALS